jgi:adenylate cyclase
MGEAIEEAGGRLDKFIGDGVMALFGVSDTPEAGARQGLVAARNMSRHLQELNRTLEHELNEPLRMGIGIHLGPAIVGEMGYAQAVTLTAIGDTVNTASRLEAMTKELGAQLVVSDELAQAAGVNLSGFPSEKVELRGRQSKLGVRVIEDASTLPV